MTLGKGNLVSRVSRLEALGAKVKKSLPSSLIDRAEIDGVDFDQSDDN
jgi:DNA recombination protein RmuC